MSTFKTKLGRGVVVTHRAIRDVFMYSEYCPTLLLYRGRLNDKWECQPVPAQKGKYLRCQHGYFHDIVWEYHNGPKPTGLWIDHINGNKWDNRISNLRLVTPEGNRANYDGSRHSFIPPCKEA